MNSSKIVSAIGHQKFPATKLSPFPFYTYPSLPLSVGSSTGRSYYCEKWWGGCCQTLLFTQKSSTIAHKHLFVAEHSQNHSHSCSASHAYTHTHTCLTHTCLDTTWPLNLSWSHLISLSLSGLGSCSPAGVSVIACRGEEKLDLSSLILCLSLLVLTLSISHSTEDCRGKLPDKGESIQLMPLNYDKLALSGKNTR